MASFGGIQAGKAFIKLTINDTEFQRGLTGATRQLDQFGKNLISIGSRFALASTAFTTPFIAAIKQFAAKGGPAADQLRFALDSLKKSTSSVAEAIGQALAPSVISFSNQVARLVPNLVAWVNTNQTLVSLLPKITIAVGLLALAMVALGAAARTVGVAFSAIALIKTHPLISAALVIGGAVGAAHLINSVQGQGGPVVAPITALTPAQRADIESGFELGSRTPSQRGLGGRRRGIERQQGSPFQGPGQFILETLDEISRPGRRGFDIAATQAEAQLRQSFTRGTFQGRLAGQIFGGGGGGVPAKLDKQIAQQEQMRKHLEHIDQKIGLGPAYKNAAV